MVSLLKRFPRSDDPKLGDDAVLRVVGFMVSDFARKKLSSHALGILEKMVRKSSELFYRIRTVLDENVSLKNAIAGMYIMEEQTLLLRAYYTSLDLWVYACRLDCLRQELIASCFLRLERKNHSDYGMILQKVAIIKRNLSPRLMFPHEPMLALFWGPQKYLEQKHFMKETLDLASKQIPTGEPLSMYYNDVIERAKDPNLRVSLDAPDEREAMRRYSILSLKEIDERKIKFEVDELLGDLTGAPTGFVRSFSKPKVEATRKKRSKPLHLIFDAPRIYESIDTPAVREAISDNTRIRIAEGTEGRVEKRTLDHIPMTIPVKKDLRDLLEIRLEGVESTSYVLLKRLKDGLILTRFSSEKNPFVPQGKCACPSFCQDKFGSCVAECYSMTGSECKCALSYGGICRNACMCGNLGCKMCEAHIYGIWKKTWKFIANWRQIIIPAMLKAGSLKTWNFFGPEHFQNLILQTGSCPMKDMEGLLNHSTVLHSTIDYELPHKIKVNELVRLIGRDNLRGQEISLIFRWGGGFRSLGLTYFTNLSRWFYIEKHFRQIKGVAYQEGGWFDQEYLEAIKKDKRRDIIRYPTIGGGWQKIFLVDAGSIFEYQPVGIFDPGGNTLF